MDSSSPDEFARPRSRAQEAELATLHGFVRLYLGVTRSVHANLTENGQRLFDMVVARHPDLARWDAEMDAYYTVL